MKLTRSQTETLRSHAEACLAEIDDKLGNAERFALLLAEVMWKGKELGIPYHNMNTKNATKARAINFTSALANRQAEWNTPTVKVTCQALGARHAMGALSEWLKADHGHKNLTQMLSDVNRG